MPPDFLCPICAYSLVQKNKSFKCENSHSFDCAKEGYVNLLPVQHKKSKQPGDNRAMVNARKLFLENGFYDLIIAPSIKLIDQYSKTPTTLDIGCGDGYFTSKIFSNLAEPKINYGMDISKEAVKTAAKRDKSINWFVASSNNFPLPDESVDVILKINSPLNYQNSHKKLSENGFVISITPGEKHLYELKSHIYNTAQTHETEVLPKNYKLLETVNLNDTLTLQNQNEIEQLFMMTPFYWNASQTAKQKIAALSELTTEIAFSIHVWQKTH